MTVGVKNINANNITCI